VRVILEILYLVSRHDVLVQRLEIAGGDCLTETVSATERSASKMKLTYWG
jgi:hypothetical protein